MSRVVVIGGSGHIGTYLVPRLVSAGYEVVSVSRGERAPYQPNGAWEFVRSVNLSRDAEENYLMAQKNLFPATIIHPGHIVGPGWAPLNPAGHFNPSVFTKLAKGEELSLPNFGLETVHHVHADASLKCSCARSLTGA
jgi:nucleoside-diphosphate-sugar epimerase